MRNKSLLTFILGLLALPIAAQTYHYPALETNNIFTGTNTFNAGIYLPTQTIGNCLKVGASHLLTSATCPTTPTNNGLAASDGSGNWIPPTSAMLTSLLGFTPLNPANNLSDVASVAAALGTLQGLSFADTSPQSMAGPLFVPSLNGYLYATNYPGADWVAQVTAAIAALPNGGGTVFVPQSIAGSATGSLTIPAGVTVSFDFGAFSLTGSITKEGQGGRIEGVSPSSTTIDFTGATNGFVVLQESTTQKDLLAENLTLETSNASFGKLFSFITGASPNNNPAIATTMRKVNLTTIGGGAATYGIFLQNMVGGAFYDTNVFGAIAVGVHGDCAAGEISFIDDFITNNGIRGYEFVPGVGPPNCGGGGDDVNIIGGGLQGHYTGSGLYAQGYTVYLSGGTHFDSTPNGSYSDGAGTVIADGFLDTNGADWGDVLTTYTSIPPKIQLKGGTFGIITTASQTTGSIIGVTYVSKTLNGAAISRHGNVLTSGALDNDFSISGLFDVVIDFAAGTTAFRQQGTTFFTNVAGATSEWTMPSAWALAWGTAGSEDSWLNRLGANTYGFGSGYLAHDGTLKIKTLFLGTTSASAFPSGAIVGTSDAQALTNKTLAPPSANKGTFTCTAGGTISISNANYIATSDVVITMHTAGGTITTPPAFETVTSSSGFSVLCGASDTSTYNYSILN